MGEGAGIERRSKVRGPRTGLALPILAALLVSVLTIAPAAFGAFPYSRNASPTGPADLYLNAGQVPNDLGGNEFKFAATPDPANTLNNLIPVELGGVRGAHVVDDDASVQTAFTTTTGRPDVTIAILDSGIKWNDAGAMADLRKKNRLNQGELPEPRNDGLGTPNEAGEDCGGGGPYTNAGDYDLNGDGVFNIIDYSCDNRVKTDTPGGVGPPGMFEPQDVLIAFSDGVDDDDNGYVDDIVGWDFVDNDNDPFDDVQYGHGTGEARDSTAEADNGGDLGSCPNCMGIYLRVGDSFVADVNRFGAAVTYATDNDVQIVQEALGTLNNSSLSREAVDYAYRHGVTVMASAADEAAQHNNWPGSLPHTIVVNSVTQSLVPSPNTSYLSLNGCTNFNAKITLAIPSTSCSSNAVGLAAGFAGLIYSAALNAHEAGALDNYPDTSACKLTNGQPCPITPNEIKQLIASGTINGTLQADDIDFAGTPAGSANEPSCSPTPLPDCTSPYGPGGALKAQVDTNRPSLVGPQIVTDSYPARRGHDQFYGYGRANMNRSVKAVIDDPVTPSNAQLPPEAEIFSPEWFSEVDPSKALLNVEGEVFARGEPYQCQILVAPGEYPNEGLTTDAAPGDFEPLTANGYCDGTTTHSGAAAASLHHGVLGSIDVADLKSRFPAGANFTGPIPTASEATADGRPFFAPQAFTFKVVVTTTTGTPRTGEDERSAYLHHDQDLLDGFPKAMHPDGKLGTDAPTTDGASSPAFADLDGDNENELIFGSSDGFVHAIRPDGTELPGWPVRGDMPGYVSSHLGSKAFAGGEVGSDLGGTILAAVAVGDTDGNGIPEVYAADFEGKVYGWDPDGKQVFEEEANPAYSGKPLTPFANVRKGSTNRTQHGFFASPVLADLDQDGDEELIAASMDRHVYAWDTSDKSPTEPGGAAPVDGFPVLVVDPAKVASVDPQTNAVTFKPDAGSYQQGAIIDTPAVGDITGGRRPEIVVGTNEEYDEPFNVGNAGGLGVLTSSGFVTPGNARLYALRPQGDTDGNPLPGDAILPGWPFHPGLLLTELLPVVGEGVSGPPVIGPVTCPSGGEGMKVGAASAAGPAYIINPDATSCYGQTQGKDNSLESDFAAATTATDTPIIPAVGNPAFGAVGAGSSAESPSFLISAVGLYRALDLLLPDYQGGQDLVGVWDPVTGQFRANFPATMNDLQFLTGPAVADIDGVAGEEVLEGSSSRDLAAYGTAGTPVNGRWPKLTTDWTVATPLIGSFGTLDTKDDARKVVVGITRSGYIHAYRTDAPACSPSSSPRFHHDNANSGDYSRDAVSPGKPTAIDTNKERTVFHFRAPGDDLLCGRADHYEVRTSDSKIDETNFRKATKLDEIPKVGKVGTKESFDVPAGSMRHLAIRAVDEQGNVGRVASIRVKPDPEQGGTGCTGSLINGTSRGDRLNGTKQADRIHGRSGNDRIRGGGGNDCAFGDGGKDRVSGNGGKDRIKGGSGRDKLRGGAGKDRIVGGGGKDRVSGGGGKDKIKVRGGGRDVVACGGGKDLVQADRRDRVNRDCERVRRNR